jgi:hypothetical protein
VLSELKKETAAPIGRPFLFYLAVAPALYRDDTVVMAAVLAQITTTLAPTPTRP